MREKYLLNFINVTKLLKIKMREKYLLNFINVEKCN